MSRRIDDLANDVENEFFKRMKTNRCLFVLDIFLRIPTKKIIICRTAENLHDKCSISIIFRKKLIWKPQLHTEVEWLSHGKLLTCLFEIKSEVQAPFGPFYLSSSG